MLLTNHWKFHLEPTLVDEHNSYWEKGYDDSNWQSVTVPHDWSVQYPFSKSNSSGTGYLPGGIGWYRMKVHLDEVLAGKSVSIRFEGVYKKAMVWCNSYFLGEWANGYTPFEFDITDFASFGDDETVIVVKVRHTDVADSRWFTGSGIYRDVHLMMKEPVDYVDGSLLIESQSVNTDHAICKIAFEVENLLKNQGKAATIVSEIVDSKGKVISSLNAQHYFEDESKQSCEFSHPVDHPSLWSDEAPNLYTHRVIINQSVRNESKFGIRNILFDPDKGFFVNGINKKLKGVCLHHDAGVLGAAVTKEVWRRRLVKLKVMGANAVRGSHNTHMKGLYELCDEMGFYFIDELFDEWEGPKNKWSTGHNVFPPKHQGYFEDFHTWYERDVEAVIKWNRNHPCIIMWSLGNEIDYPNDPYCHPMFEEMTGNNDKNKPSQERQYNPNKPNAERIVKLASILKNEVLKYDTSRPITMALAYPELSREIGLLDVLDVVGYNYKEEHYSKDHKSYPDKPFVGSENGHHLKAWEAVANVDYISGQFLWTGIDYLGEAHGWPIRGSYAGHMTTAAFEKIDYYHRQVMWCDHGIIQIMTRRTVGEDDWHLRPVWRYDEGEEVSVKIMTNAKAVSVDLNGRMIKGVKAMDTGFEFTVPYEMGVLTCQGWYGDELLERQLSTPTESLSYQVARWDDPELRSDEIRETHLTQYEVMLVDDQGRYVADRDVPVKVRLKGPGVIKGIDNGDLSDLTDYSDLIRSTYLGRMIVYIEGASELTSLKFESVG